VAITSGHDDEPEDVDSDASGYLVYELNEWSRESRQMLQQLLEGAEIPFVWESTNLVVPAPFETRADEAVQHAEAMASPPLDPDAEKVLYEMAEWTDGEITVLVDALAGAEIPYDFDVDDNLIVLAVDEDRVEELFDSIELPDEADDGEEEGGERVETRPSADVLSDLFVAADRLRRHARDHEGVLGFVRAAEDLDLLRLPYGFEAQVWQKIVEGADRLRGALEGDDAGDEEIEELAEEYRTLLRDYV
jgi:hypothetical protein